MVRAIFAGYAGPPTVVVVVVRKFAFPTPPRRSTVYVHHIFTGNCPTEIRNTGKIKKKKNAYVIIKRT